MPLITSANVACGAHAGDPNVMAATVRLARQHGVAVGAHPGYPDLNGFGRRALPLDTDEVMRWTSYQLGALYAIARSEGADLSHVKPHGALYNTAAKDPALADAIAAAMKAFSPDLLFFCPPGSEMHRAALDAGLKVAREGFADRAYEPNGSLMNRSLPGSVHTTRERVAEQALQLAEGWVLCSDGTRLSLEVETICIHSDTPGAPEMVRAVRAAFDKRGIPVERVSAHVG